MRLIARFEVVLSHPSHGIAGAACARRLRDLDRAALEWALADAVQGMIGDSRLDVRLQGGWYAPVRTAKGKP